MKLTEDNSAATSGIEATAQAVCASLQSTATLRSLSKAKDNMADFVPEHAETFHHDLHVEYACGAGLCSAPICS